MQIPNSLIDKEKVPYRLLVTGLVQCDSDSKTGTILQDTGRERARKHPHPPDGEHEPYGQTTIPYLPEDIPEPGE